MLNCSNIFVGRFFLTVFSLRGSFHFNDVVIIFMCQYKIYFSSYQSCIYRFGIHFGLTIRMGYFGTGQYRCSVSGLPQIYIYILIYSSIHLFIKIYNLLVRNLSNYKHITILILIIIISLHLYFK